MAAGRVLSSVALAAAAALASGNGGVVDQMPSSQHKRQRLGL